MPVRILTLGGTEGLFSGKTSQLTAENARKWLKTAGIPLPVALDGILSSFLNAGTSTYGFLQYDAFMRDLLTYTFSKQVSYNDAIFRTSNNVLLQRTVSIVALLTKLQIRAPLPIPDGFVTPDDLFGLSVLLSSEVGLVKNDQNKLFVYSSGNHDKVSIAKTYTVLLHTHPTFCTEKYQLDNDLNWADPKRVELMVSESVIVFFTHGHIFNDTALTDRQKRILCSRNDMGVDRNTPLTLDLFAKVEKALLSEKAKQEEDEMERYRSSASTTTKDDGVDPFEYMF